MTDNQDSGIEVIEIDMDEYEAAENHIKVREACTLQYNQLATQKASGDDIVFSADAIDQSVTLTFKAAEQALKDTNAENMEKYGIPNEEIEIGIRESQKPVTFEFLDEPNM